MLLERAPRKTGFEEVWSPDQVDEPRGKAAKQEERESKEADCHEPEESTGRPLESGRVPGRPAPPADEPAQEGNRMVRGMRITDRPVDCERENEDGARKDQVCRYHMKSAPAISAMNAARLKISILV